MSDGDDTLRIERGVDAVKCDCGGYAGLVESTEEECRNFGCYRDEPGSECCAASFVCCLCAKRHVRRREAPEYD